MAESSRQDDPRDDATGDDVVAAVRLVLAAEGITTNTMRLLKMIRWVVEREGCAARGDGPRAALPGRDRGDEALMAPAARSDLLRALPTLEHEPGLAPPGAILIRVWQHETRDDALRRAWDWHRRRRVRTVDSADPTNQMEP